jgi:hypothetical protein
VGVLAWSHQNGQVNDIAPYLADHIADDTGSRDDLQGLVVI